MQSPFEKSAQRRVAILGSTGSIGRQALEVIAANPGLFAAEVLTAQRNAGLLIEQALQFKPNAVVICEEQYYDQVFEALDPHGIKVYAGARALASVCEMETIDIVLTALVGFAGLLPTLRAIDAGKPIALANKETLVVAGQLVTQRAMEKAVNIYPVDSEHSAIFQCLAGEAMNSVEKLILTASGGPFRTKDLAFLHTATKAQALKHPNWDMGAKITIDSASLMNKGLEVIEAHWLFGIPASQIEVVVHPQSIIHSMVQFKDGSIKAQLGLPDMRLPIQYALGFPQRVASDFPRYDFLTGPALTFERPDLERFPNLATAFRALEKGGNASCIINAANEVAVQAFLEERIGFMQIAEIVANALETQAHLAQPSLDDLQATDAETRRWATAQTGALTPPV